MARKNKKVNKMTLTELHIALRKHSLKSKYAQHIEAHLKSCGYRL